MKKTHLMIALAAFGATGLVQAGGMSVGLSLDRLTTTTSQNYASGSDGGVDFAGGEGGKQSLLARAEVAYTVDVNPSVAMAFGIGTNLNNPKVAQGSGEAFSGGNTVPLSTQEKLKSGGTFLFVQPEFKLNDKTAAIVRVGYSTVKTDGTLTATGPGGTASENISSKYKGLTYGIGLKTEIAPQIDGFVMIEELRYEEKGDSSNKASSTAGRLGVQYRF